MKIDRWFMRAQFYASQSTEKYRLGAILVKGDSFMAGGFNSRRNDPEYIDHMQCGTCAEHATMRQVRDCSGMTLFVVRISRTGTLAMARPCGRCRKMIAEAGIKKTFYSISDHEMGRLDWT